MGRRQREEPSESESESERGESDAPDRPEDENPRGQPRSWALSWLGRARRRWWVRWGMDIGILVAVVWAIGLWQSRHLLAGDEPAPAFALPDLDGGLHRLADYRGQTVLLLFFSPGCPVCKVESDNWGRVQRWREDVRVFGVAGEHEDRQAVLDFLGSDRADVPVLLATPAMLRAYHVDRYPTHYIINPDGTIRWRGVGYTTTLGLLARLL